MRFAITHRWGLFAKDYCRLTTTFRENVFTRRKFQVSWCLGLNYHLLLLKMNTHGTYVQNPLAWPWLWWQQSVFLFGWMSRALWLLCSHMPIRRLRLLIASQPLGWCGSERHTWLRRFMTSSLQPSLSSLFMGPVLVWRPSVQLLIKKKKKCKQRRTETHTTWRHPSVMAPQEVNQSQGTLSRFHTVNSTKWCRQLG